MAMARLAAPASGERRRPHPDHPAAAAAAAAAAPAAPPRRPPPSPSQPPPSRRRAGRCNMRGDCGKKSFFSPSLPCALDEAPAQQPTSSSARSKLVGICGTAYAEGAVCCDEAQLDALKSNLDQAEALIAACPACRNNFRSLFCDFTCSPNQSQFLDVSQSQKMATPGQDGDVAVKTVEYHISDAWKQAFFDSCKDVKFGASNGFAMELIGGGATDKDAFLKFLGDEKPLVGSPFQINFPHHGDRSDDTAAEIDTTAVRHNDSRATPPAKSPSKPPALPRDPPPRNCYDEDLGSRCACTDCPQVCAVLPEVPPPSHGDTCTLGDGRISCYTFALVAVYLLGLLAALLGFGLGRSLRRGRRADDAARAGGRTRRRLGLRHRHSGISVSSEASGYERMRLDSDTSVQPSPQRQPGRGGAGMLSSASDASEPDSLGGRRPPRVSGLLGATAGSPDGYETLGRGDLGYGLGHDVLDGAGASDVLDPLGAPQPRSYALNAKLADAFYAVGLRSAHRPYLTFAAALVVVALCNLGWRHFAVETDPVRLWVAPQSQARLDKEYFDHHFGPFYRTQQLFVLDASGAEYARARPNAPGGGEGKSAAGDAPRLEDARAALDWDRLVWLADVEAEVRALRTPRHGLTLRDVCFKPAGDDGPCVVQSIMGYFQDDLEGYGLDADSWASALDQCAASPAECLPTFGQPLKPNVVLGGVPKQIPLGNGTGTPPKTRPGRASDARATVTTWVVANSLDANVTRRAAEWEAELEKLLLRVSGRDAAGADGGGGGAAEEHPLSRRRRELGLEVAFSTEISLEEEIGSSSNADTGIIALSYVLMLLYASFALGGGGSSSGGGVGAGGGGHDANEGAPVRAVSQAAASRPHGATHRSGFAGHALSLLTFWRTRRGEHPGVRAQRSRTASRLARRLFVDTKFSLGLFGVSLVLASVASAVGLFSYAGVKVTLVVGEVLPFLLLAVGVDNIFLLQAEMDRQNALASTANPYASASLARGGAGGFATAAAGVVPDEEEALLADFDDAGNARRGDAGWGGDGFLDDDGELRRRAGYYLPSHERAARTLSRVGPSILLSAATQVTSFLLGALVPMPAVRNFALYAAGSMAICVALQCTAFVAAMALDADRTEAGRIDCLPCLKLDRPASASASASASSAWAGATLASAGGGYDAEGWLGRFMRRVYAPALVRPRAKKLVFAAFAGVAVAALVGVRHVEMGLDQRLALPPQSYLRDYFDALDAFLDVGPPVYFVARRVDPTSRPGQQALCGRFTTCAPLSLANTLEGERRRPEASFLAEPASSWIDDFLQWLNPALESCCRVRKREPDVFCSPRDSGSACRPCFEGREPAWNITLYGMPESDEFVRYLRQWLVSPTDEECPLGGQAAYSTALSLRSSSPSAPPSSVSALAGAGLGLEAGAPRPSELIEASHFRTYHTPLRTQADFIDALAAARRVSSDISSRNADAGVEVFAYSVFYAFFEQYAHLGWLAAQVLALSAASVLLITALLLGSWRTAAVVVACVASALLGVGGTMGALGVGFNALTLVNLVVCAAICVEFCAHVARAFMRAPGALPRGHPLAQRERDERAWAALADVGKSVLSGITGTKIVGISVLSFTRSDLLKLYYARMWASLIVMGALHGLVLLPVALATFGGRGYSTGEDEAEVSRRLARAHEQNESMPFGADDDDEDDDDDEEGYYQDGRQGYEGATQSGARQTGAGVEG